MVDNIPLVDENGSILYMSILHGIYLVTLIRLSEKAHVGISAPSKMYTPPLMVCSRLSHLVQARGTDVNQA